MSAWNIQERSRVKQSILVKFDDFTVISCLNPLVPDVQKHKHNNNSAAFAAELLLCVWPFLDSQALKNSFN